MDRKTKCYKEKKICDDCGNCKTKILFANVNGKVEKILPDERINYNHVFNTHQEAFYYED